MIVRMYYEHVISFQIHVKSGRRSPVGPCAAAEYSCRMECSYVSVYRRRQLLPAPEYSTWLCQLIFDTLDVYIAYPPLCCSVAEALLFIGLLYELILALRLYVDEAPDMAQEIQCLISSMQWVFQIACSLSGMSHHLTLETPQILMDDLATPNVILQL